MPDIHQLSPYKLGFINEKIEFFAKENNFKYLDLLNVFNGIDEKKIWNDHNDPHPNGYAHGLMARDIYDFFSIFHFHYKIFLKTTKKYHYHF